MANVRTCHLCDWHIINMSGYLQRCHEVYIKGDEHIYLCRGACTSAMVSSLTLWGFVHSHTVHTGGDCCPDRYTACRTYPNPSRSIEY